jgi:hypothetical protein
VPPDAAGRLLRADRIDGGAGREAQPGGEPFEQLDLAARFVADDVEVPDELVDTLGAARSRSSRMWASVQVAGGVRCSAS